MGSPCVLFLVLLVYIVAISLCRVIIVRFVQQIADTHEDLRFAQAHATSALHQPCEWKVRRAAQCHFAFNLLLRVRLATCLTVMEGLHLSHTSDLSQILFVCDCAKSSGLRKEGVDCGAQLIERHADKKIVGLAYPFSGLMMLRQTCIMAQSTDLSRSIEEKQVFLSRT